MQEFEYIPETEEQSDDTQQLGFTIDSDSKAEWALKKIADNNKEAERLINVCDAHIFYYTEKKKGYEQKRDKDNDGLTSMLEAYFDTVERKATKTRETYILPSGKLVRNQGKPEFVPDKELLTDALTGTEFVTHEPKLAWGEYKKTLSIVDGNVVDVYGEIVEGITINERPPEFKITF